MTPIKRDGGVIASYRARAGDCCEVCRWRPRPALRDVAGTAKIQRLLPIHHIHPIACGGPDSEANLVQLCLNCHGIAHHMGQMLFIEHQRQREWTGPRTRRDFFFSMAMLANRPEYVRFAAMGHRCDQYLAVLEEEAAEQDAIEVVRITRAFTVSGSAREVYGRRRA